jgi:hypothetical protein
MRSPDGEWQWHRVNFREHPSYLNTGNTDGALMSDSSSEPRSTDEQVPC